MYVTIRLEPMTANKPQMALNEACDVARRLGCAVEVAVNGVSVRIGPTTPKNAVFNSWGKAATAEAVHLNGSGDQA